MFIPTLTFANYAGSLLQSELRKLDACIGGMALNHDEQRGMWGPKWAHV